MSRYEQKFKHRKHQEDWNYLYYSSHVFILSSLASILYQRLDIFFLSSSILLTSILRWGEPLHKGYTFVDRNWVKVVFFHLIYSFVSCCLQFKYDSLLLFWCFGLLLTVVALYMTELFIFTYWNTRKGIALHMLVHIYTMAGFVSCLLLEHNFVSIKNNKYNDKLCIHR